MKKHYAAGLVFMVTACTVHANESIDVIHKGSNTVVELFPHSNLYPENIADPKRPTFMLSTMHFDDTTITDTSRERLGAKAGGRFGLFRIYDEGNPEEAFQLNFNIGIIGQADKGQSDDVIGWDGILALMGLYRYNSEWAVKFGLHHDSSHVGDEFIERNGRERINYTRKEAQLGASWTFSPDWQAYVETGYGFGMGNTELQESWRWQTGVQFQSAPKLWRDKLGWYAALDIGATEERDYSVDKTLQVGFVFYSGTRRWRMGLEMYNGRAQIGEFFQEDEKYVSFALWLDL